MNTDISLSSFDATERISTRALRPETYRHLLEHVSTEKVAIARGAGLSYSAASFGSGVASIDLTRFDRILSYDKATGSVDVEPGVRVGRLMEFLAQRGRYLPALPGYPAITVGGCIGFDIHGKSQFHSGNFGRWLQEFELHHKDHGHLTCSQNREAELFQLTQGGAGLTGIITKATLRTLPLPGTAVEVQALPVKDLREAADVLRAQAEDADCLYSWNDLNLRGTRFGRGLVFSERFVDAQPQQQAAHPTHDIRARLPFRVWNGAATTAALAAFYRLQLRSQPRLLSLQAAAFPIYGKEYYYAAFGRGGFREYQLIVPFEGWSGFITSLEQQIERARIPVTLGSLKLFRGESQNLRFCMDGICLALDVPASRRASALFEQLDKLAIQFGAVVNLSKDSRLTAELCQQVFPEYDSFRTALARFDAKRRYQSRLRTQVGV